MLQIIEKKSIHVCLDKAGLLSWEKLNLILEYIDTVLYDIKAFDSKIHYQCTLQNNDRILDNFKKVTEKGMPVFVRVVMIPDENDDL